jgi:two-component system, cell cycle sensor histidine kinase and response regulator CckA
MTKTLRVLQVEDSESDAGLIVRRLENAGYNIQAARVQDADAMRAALAESAWDLIVCDYRMPEFDAPRALAVLQETGLDIPFLVVSGTIGEDVAVAMMRAGANDYLMKDKLARLGAAVERELRDAQTRAERRQALSRLEESEAQLKTAIDSTEMGIFDYNLQSGKLFWSELTKKHLNWPGDRDPSFEDFLDCLHPEDRGRVEEAMGTAFRPESRGRYEVDYRTKTPVSGEHRWISAWGRVLFDAQGEPVRFLGAIRDITRRRRKERELEYQLQLTACITEQSADSIMLTGRDGEVRFVNPEMERMFGFTIEDFKGGSAHEMLHHHYPDGRPYPESECRLSMALAAGEILREHEDVYFHKNGVAIDTAVSCAPLELNGERIGSVYTFRDITERKRAERALRQSDARFRRLFEADIIGILITDGEHILETNDHFLHILGYTRDEFSALQIAWRTITPPDMMEVSERAATALLETGVCPAFEKEYIRKDGTHVPVLFAGVELNRSEGKSQRLCFVVDLTERKSLEKQFRQAQKLESVGQLAGSVAHDFNNLLTVILGYADLVLAGMNPRDPSHNAIGQISAAANRAAGLTRQLLTFSRWNAGAARTVALDDIVSGIQGMLKRLIGEHIQVVVSSAAEAGFIHADPGLIEQVIVNLAVNARDAMPEGGKLLIESSRITVGDDFAAQVFSVPQGAYVSLAVTDTGTGMTPEVQARLFEPFFTTKEPGKGTGLGLSTVFGIVKQSGGSITVHSTPGIGTAFRVLFPAASRAGAEEKGETVETFAQGTETVLLVEDEPGVRSYVQDVLEANGYRVLDAKVGSDAMEIARRYDGPIHLLITDLGLPGMRGTEVVRRFQSLRPGMAVLTMSGYPGRFGAEIDEAIPLLQKPFTPYVLLNKIREILDGAGVARSSGA